MPVPGTSSNASAGSAAEGALKPSLIKMWHGGPSGTPPDLVRPSPVGTHEYGQGIYLTNSAATAQRYARRSSAGALYEVVLRQPERWLQDTRLDVAYCEAFLGHRATLGMKPWRKIMADLSGWSDDAGTVAAPWFVNSCVDHQALGGAHGPALAQWLTEQGAGASLLRQSRTESWIVVFDARLVVLARKVSRVGSVLEDFPIVHPDACRSSSIKSVATEQARVERARSFIDRQSDERSTSSIAARPPCGAG